MDMRELAELAKGQLATVTGLKPVTVSGIFRDEQGWHVARDLLEMSRIPPATDVVGEYEVLLDESGSMMRFDRKRTRLRGEAAERERG